MIIRQALVSDIPQIQIVRHSVNENKLSDPSLVPDSDVEDYINNRGKGWVCEINSKIIGFSIADLVDHNVWALFIRPEHEGKGIGKQLHDEMMHWYFKQKHKTIWLSTWPGTRAENFYVKAGWADKGIMKNNERRFEMTQENWSNLHK
jgi:GNAT superfamily N-acetyltransferase